MPFEDTNTLKFNQYQKSDIASFVIYAELKCIIGKVDACKNNPENSFKSKWTYSVRFFNVYIVVI